ncbi:MULTISPECIES: ABCB family ABC transporter ATP-binding protein/permease [Rhizobium]|uniref:ABCB family ABC transporter ATP-binding protein/permease n=1 Tax=Rhizobium TaxID=379 RepID=UPI002180B7DC|nr:MULTISPECIES: ABC transporter ATP-binding protein/permease [Rhizobium]MBX4893799.1 ABC transporter ATP-binding protein/permease [Rhizobium bangladeshense]MBX5014459.1 ABC transporter ATP-binding protein/permease [Rhizobium lentis]
MFDFRTVRDLLPYLWPKDAPALRRAVVYSLLCLIAAKVVTSLVPLTYKALVDHLDGNAATIALPTGLVLAYGGARLMATVFEELRIAVFTRVSGNATRLLGLRVFRQLHQLSLRFHLDRKTGGLARAIERGTQGISVILSRVLFSIVPIVLEVALVCTILWHLFGASFSLVTLVTVVIYAGFTIVMTSWRTRFRRFLNDASAEASSRSIDSLLNYETVKYFGNEEHEAQRLDYALRQQEQASVQSQWTFVVLSIGQTFIISVGLVVVMLMAAQRIKAGEMSLGDLVLVNAYVLQLYQPLNFFGLMYREIRQALIDMEEMLKLLHTEAEVPDRKGAHALDVKGGLVEFANVSFGYDDRRQILDNISFKIPAGQTVAIVGATGAGKSTLSRLLYRFFDVTGGAIFIDGQDIRGVTQHSLRAAIGIVPQDTVLFNDTIRYNIGYGRPDATEAQIEAAAQSAHIYTFINGLSDGYHTRVGERGLKLSGGEKQRVAIARAILKGPQIMVFDEATSALDTATEREIQTNLREVSRYHTTMIIAHRLSTVVDADEIIVLEAGQIIERGSHAELLERDGQYAAMWKSQASEAGELIR